MASNISEEEFIRLQNQLIELRTSNYVLEEKNALHVSRHHNLTSRLEALEKDCEKLRALLNIQSKKIKHAELIHQNETLLVKLQTQEDDFRRQCQTLLEEISELVAKNEKLESRINANACEAASASEGYDKVKNLTDESSALQRALSEERLRSAREISKLKVVLNLLTEGINEDLKNDLCQGIEHEVYESQPTSNHSSPILYMNEGENFESMCIDKDEEKADKMVQTEEICSKEEAEEELREVKDELDVLKGTYGLELLKLSEALQLKKEKYLTLEESLSGLQERFVECRRISDLRTAELERSLESVIAERERNVVSLNKLILKKKELEAEVKKLKAELSETNMESKVVHSQLIESANKLDDLNLQLSSVQAENEELGRTLTETKMILEAKSHIIDAMTVDNDRLTAEYNEKILTLESNKNLLESKHKEAMDSLTKMKSNLEVLEKTNSLKDKEMKQLEQQLADSLAEHSLSEKKGSVICRDLKRQIASERRRVEKLQEKIRELTDSCSISKQDSSKGGDAEIASLSSWSLMSGNTEPQESGTQDSSLVATLPINLNGNSDDTDLGQENKDLLERLTALQEEKWIMEEKINHLEQGSAAMAEDLMKKADVIQFYCMDGRPVTDPQPTSTGRKTVKKLSEFLKGSEEEHLQESNSRMQRMLEELLTKNMYLQRDIEQMSKELEGLVLQSKEKNDS